MPDKGTVAELFELAVAAEKIAEKLYLGLQAKFAQHQDVADFWRRYAAEEVGHASWLARMRGALNPEQLSAPADPLMLEDARRLLKFSPHTALSKVKNLDDAYELVSELENAETNTVFDFILTNFAFDEIPQAFLRSQLQDHIARLMLEFPKRFSHPASRRAVKALE